MNQIILPEKGIVTDYALASLPKGFVVDAVNAVDAKEGFLGKYANEPGFTIFNPENQYVPGQFLNDYITFIDFKKHHEILIPDGRTILFITSNNKDYILVLFENSFYPVAEGDLFLSENISAIVKPNNQRQFILYFSNAPAPVRYVNIDDGLHEINYTQIQNDLPDINLSVEENRGNLQGGKYYFLFRYNNNRVTSRWHIHGDPVNAYIEAKSDVLTNKAVKLDFSNLEAKYKYFQIGIIHYQNNEAICSILGKSSIPSTGNKSVLITGNERSIKTTLEEFLVEKPLFKSVDQILIKSNTMLYAGVEYFGNFNYQPYANKIQVKIEEYNHQLLWDEKGRLRDVSNSNDLTTVQKNEVYAIAIELVFKSGRKSIPWHIPWKPEDDTLEYRSVLEYPEEFDYGNLADKSKNIRHHKIPGWDQYLSSYSRLRFKLENIEIPDEIKSDLVGINLLISDRKKERRVIASGAGFLCARVEGAGSEDEKKPIIAMGPANPVNDSYYSGEGKAVLENLITFFSPDLVDKPALKTNKLILNGRFEKSFLRDPELYHSIQDRYVHNNPDCHVYEMEGDIIADVANTYINIKEAVYVQQDSRLYFLSNQSSYLGEKAFYYFKNDKKEATTLIEIEAPGLPNDATDDSRADDGYSWIPYLSLINDIDNLYGNIEDINYIKLGKTFTGLTYSGNIITNEITGNGDCFLNRYTFYRHEILRDASGIPNDKVNSFLARYNLGIESLKAPGVYIDKNQDIMNPIDKVVGETRTYNYLNKFQYNADIEQGDVLFNSYGSYNDLKLENKYPNRIHYSLRSTREEEMDSHSLFLPNNYTDIGYEHGKLVNIFIMNNELNAHMEGGILKLFTRPQQIEGSEGTVFIGMGDLFSVPEEDTGVPGYPFGGLSDRRNAYMCEYGYFFLDTINQKIFRLTDQLQDISSGYEKKTREILNNSSSVYFGYDTLFKRLMIGFDQDKCRSYGMLKEGIISRHSYYSAGFIRMKDSLLTIAPAGKIHKMNSGPAGRYYLQNDYYPFELSLICNEAVRYKKKFISLSIKNLTLDSNNRNQFKTFNKIRFKTESKDTNELGMILRDISLINPSEDLVQYRFIKDHFNLKIPKNRTVNGVDVIDNADPLDTESVRMSKFRDRMSGEYLVINLRYDNDSNNLNFIFDYIDVNYSEYER